MRNCDEFCQKCSFCGNYIPGKRGRGRPRKSEQSQPTTPNSRKLPSQATSPGSGSDTSRLTLTEQENSAAEGLLGLSDCG